MGKREKTIYVIIRGRGGNQLFQYAFARAVQEKTGGRLVLDFSELELVRRSGLYSPDTLLENFLEHFNVREYTCIGAPEQFEGGRGQRIKYLIFRAIQKLYRSFPKREGLITRLTSPVLQRIGIYFQYDTASPVEFRMPWGCVDQILIRGWFESASYFEAVQEIIREELVIKEPLSPTLEPLRRRFVAEESICVHVRRGDFLSENYRERYLICDADYYRKGVALLREKFPGASLFVCSDDIEWCRTELFAGEEDVVFEPAGIPITDTMLLMTACHHFVLSNSTFSFWMQYLATWPGKTVVAPSLWLRSDSPKRDIYQPDWILIDCR